MSMHQFLPSDALYYTNMGKYIGYSYNSIEKNQTWSVLESRTKRANLLLSITIRYVDLKQN